MTLNFVTTHCRPRLPRLRRRLAPLAVAAALLPSVGWAGPGWEALPDETVFALRMPNTRAFIDNFRNQTIAGQQIFTAERFEKLQTLLQNQDPDDWQQFNETLARYGFTMNDLLELAQSNWGMGLVPVPREAGQLPRMVLLGWADMDEARIDQIYAALDQAQQQNPDSDQLRTAEYQLGGTAVRQYSMPEMGMDREADWSTPDNFFEMTEAQQEEHWKKVEEQNNAAQYVKIDETHMLLARRPGRLVMGLGFPQSKDQVRQQLADGQEIQWDQATDLATINDTLEGFLGSLGGEQAGPFAARMLAEPDAAGAVGYDNTLFEFYGDLSKVLSLVGDGIRNDPDVDPQQAEMYGQALTSLGLDKLGVIAGSGYFSDQALRYQLFAQAPDRTGLPATLDAATLPAGPPQWVPAGVSYFHLAYDLSKLYDVVMQTVTDLGGPEAAQNGQMVNMMVQAYAGADIPTILKAMGTRHGLILLDGQEMTLKSQEYDFETDEIKTVENEVFMRPGALVWDLQDAPVLQGVVAAIKGMIGQDGAEQGVQLVDEQGFTGFRMDEEPFPASLMVNDQRLMFGFGPDIAGRTLTLLNQPPAEDNRLAGSALMQEAGQMIQLRDNVMFFVQDGGQDIIGSKRMMSHALEAEMDGEDGDFLRQLMDLLPTDQELRSSFGVSVGQIFMTERGLVYEGAAATPAPGSAPGAAPGAAPPAAE